MNLRIDQSCGDYGFHTVQHKAPEKPNPRHGVLHGLDRGNVKTYPRHDRHGNGDSNFLSDRQTLLVAKGVNVWPQHAMG